MSTGQRSSVVASTLDSSWGTLRGAAEAIWLLDTGLIVCSAKLFQLEQTGHWPIQRRLSLPHSLHTKTIFDLATC